MTKANITQYSSTASSNTDIDDINIDENCPASGLNNALRSLMSHLKNVDTGTQALTALSVTGVGTFGSLDISGNIDVDGTTNLDVVDIDGAVDMASTLKVDGNVGIGVTASDKFEVLGVNGIAVIAGTDVASTFTTFKYNTSTVSGFIGNGSSILSGANNSDFIVRSQADLVFASGGNTRSMTIDSTGAITKPNQPAFNAYANTQSNIAVASDTTVQFQNERFDNNADYNTSDGKFTAPVTGKYQFNVSLYLQNIDSASGYYYLELSTSNENYYSIFGPAGLAADTDFWDLTISHIVDMDASDTCRVDIHQSHGTAQTDINANSFFSGFLVC
mgnify:CR=1 FL=1